MKIIEEFFMEIDRLWKVPVKEKIPLRVLGCSSLLMQTDYARGTKDSDIFETAEMTAAIQKKMLKLAGKNSRLHKKYRMYVEFVAESLPFLPAKPLFHAVLSLNKILHNFQIEALDVADVAVSKLKTFRPHDVDDIRAMSDMKYLRHAKLIERFRKALDRWLIDARAADLPQYIENLHTTERDIFMAAETPIELPEWLTNR